MPAKKEPDYIKLAAQLNKIQLKLCGFTLEDMINIDREELSPEEADNLAADMNLFYNKGFKNQLDKLIMFQMKEMATNAEHPYQIQFIRGSISFGVELKNWFEAQIPKTKSDQQGNQPNAGGIGM